MLTLVDGLDEKAIYQPSDRLISQIFPTLELTVKEVLQIENA
ncbi:MAG: hypothetical protein ACRC06_05675 [Waterburya sp.]